MFEVADLVPLPQPPKLPGGVVLRASADEAIDAMAADLLVQAHNCARTFGDFHLAVSAVGTEAVLRRLMYDPALRELPWKRTHLWMVEEYAVAGGDERRLFPHLRDLLVEPSDIPPDQVHEIGAEADRAGAAEAYEASLREHLGWREKGHDRLDYVLLSGGSSLVGGAAETPELSDALVRTVRESEARPGRVELAPRLVRASRLIAVLATGEPSRPAVQRAASRRRDRLGIEPLAGELRWYLDHDACPRGDTV